MKTFIAKFESRFGGNKFMSFESKDKAAAEAHGRLEAKMRDLKFVKVTTVPRSELHEDMMGEMVSYEFELLDR